ncbi:MAG: cupin domain-containing protein [Erysipelotrichaceae bacterium]|nr:cupin domain-containing protein [Erysipelotrichaceae bacterium]
MSAEEIIKQFGLERHVEGGWYKQTWLADTTIPEEVLGDPYNGSRQSASLIYFLLKKGEESRLHTVSSSELWLYHDGGILELEIGDQKVLLGPGHQYQGIVPSGVVQSARVLEGDYVLVSCVVSPAFDFADFRLVQIR